MLRVHVGEFGFCVAFVLFGSGDHDVDVDDGDGEWFPPVQDLLVPTTVMKMTTTATSMMETVNGSHQFKISGFPPS